MRLLLDANLSPKRIGRPLQRRGHDVVSLASDPALSALDDPQVLEFAADEQRILVTRNSRDFAPILREWAEGDRHQCGCILLWTPAHNEFGRIIDGVQELVEARADPSDWRDLTIAL